VKLFLDRGCKLGSSHSPINTVGKTAFHWACDFGDFEMAELLLRNGADMNAKGPHMNTGLHFATISDQNAMVQWLLNRNAEITPNGDGRTILHIASVRGNFEIVKLVADHTRTNVKDNFGFCAFSLACLRGHFEIVSYLYDNCINKPDLDLEDSLQRSAESGYTKIMQFLLQKGASVNAPNENGETPLSIACHGRHSQHDQYEAVKLLLEHDAQMTIVDSRGYTPLSMALLREQNDIAALLIQHGAPVDAIKPSYDSPLQIAFSTSNPLLVKYLIQAGCHLCREKWFSDKSASEKIAEFDFHIPGPLRFRQECQYQKEAWEWIKHKACQPRTLAQFARRCIRQNLLNVRNGKSIYSSVKRLPLPFTLVKYVSLEDVLQE
jgi:ankyrin repeat protein